LAVEVVRAIPHLRSEMWGTRRQPNQDKVRFSSDYQTDVILVGTSPIRGIDIHGSCANLPATPEEVETVAAKKTYEYKGRQVPGEPVEFESSSEPFAQYKLADGTVAKVKVVLLEAVRVEGEYNNNGDPIYLFQFQQIIGVMVPPELKRPEPKGKVQ
jgi:hypothetical protein